MGMATFVTPLTSPIVIGLTPTAQFLQGGGSVDNPAVSFSGEGGGERRMLEKLSTVFLPRRCSIYVPVGFFSCVASVPADDSKTKDLRGKILVCSFRTKMPAECPPQEVLATLQHAWNRLFDTQNVPPWDRLRAPMTSWIQRWAKG